MNPLSLNLYTYVLNNPLKYIDPSGNRPCEGAYNCDGDPKSPPSTWKQIGDGVYQFADAYTMGALSDYIDVAQSDPYTIKQLISAGELVISVIPLGKAPTAALQLEKKGMTFIEKMGKWFGIKQEVKGVGNAFQWTGKNFSQMGKNMSPNEMISNLEKSGWTKTVEAGGKKSGPATILTDPSTGTKVRIHAEPGEGTPCFRVQNKGGGYLDDNGVFPSNATKQELRDSTHFNFEKQVSGVLATNLHDVLDNFDFTDSIVTEVKWADNLIDLIVVVDYYWDIQDGHDTTRLLKIIFKDCKKADFQIRTELSLSPDEVNKESLFTIVLFKELAESSDKQKHVGIFTTDYSNPWLSAVCSDVVLEEQQHL